MNIAVIGLGSMGKRRVRLLLEFIRQEKADMAACWRIYGVDAREDRRAEAERLYGIKTCENLKEALGFCKAAIVSTSPLSHATIIRECLAAGLDVFTELNLVPDGYEENMRLAREGQRVLFLSSTFLYRAENRYIIQVARSAARPLNYSYHVGQYLPDWHPWETVQDYFIADKRTNGCRELMAIEFPWLTAALGPIVSAEIRKSCNTRLPIAYDNNYLLLLEHQGTGGLKHKGVLAIDVMSRRAVRNFEMFNEELYLSWDGTPEGLLEHDNERGEERRIELYEQVVHQDGYSSFVIENGYYDELKAFVRAVEQRDLTCGGNYGFAEDLRTLRWLDRIEGYDE